MIVCSCNALSHTDIESAVKDGACRPSEIYASRRCKAQCGNCVPGIICLLRAALKQTETTVDYHASLATLQGNEQAVLTA
ncbi:MAG: (2Fe-2S)-binding protein [Acetobacter sp.]|jgi:bacterioferritin-associated ferredoxin|nr:(2Fe-2S)-binding protein [Acetobacter sp.]MCH4061719.1 (2Fe-2S)-binding protein [Acetobacter sp.]MCH4089432.1 (2Fe-2S)-binding protein [Acetobacter sp.]MCI1293804.1 (2Fe-2S)-binding protein [Acetobacter sp.]MCI1320388.1 (2Fe-2S)-binding protein [Acetobacter sp.]